MVSHLHIAFTLASASIAVVAGQCMPGDSQCIVSTDMNSMIQANMQTTKLQNVVVDEAQVVHYSKVFDGMVNATAVAADNLYHHKVSFATRVMYACVSWAIYVTFAMLVWTLMYPAAPEKAAVPGDVEDPTATMTNGHFQCFASPEICICAALCPGLRWADTMSLIGYLKITTALSAIFFCQLLNGFAYGNAFMGISTWALLLYYRHQLREQFEMPSWTCSTCCIDAIYIFFCPGCAIVQEARAVTHHLQKS